MNISIILFEIKIYYFDLLPNHAVEPLARKYYFENQDFDKEARNEIETFLKKQNNINDSTNVSYLEKVNGIDWEINSRLKRRGIYSRITEDNIWEAYFIWENDTPKWKKPLSTDFFIPLDKLEQNRYKGNGTLLT